MELNAGVFFATILGVACAIGFWIDSHVRAGRN